MFILICSYNVYSLFEIELKEGIIFSVEKDLEAVIHLMLKHDGKTMDEYTLRGAPDTMIKSFDYFEWNKNAYILIVFDYGSLGTMTQIEMVDVLIFSININKFDLIKNINIKNIVYDGKTKKYYSDRDLSYFHDKNKNAIILFEQSEGKIVLAETHSMANF